MAVQLLVLIDLPGRCNLRDLGDWRKIVGLDFSPILLEEHLRLIQRFANVLPYLDVFSP
jgi:hypothetical protein